MDDISTVTRVTRKNESYILNYNNKGTMENFLRIKLNKLISCQGGVSDNGYAVFVFRKQLCTNGLNILINGDVMVLYYTTVAA